MEFKDFPNLSFFSFHLPRSSTSLSISIFPTSHFLYNHPLIPPPPPLNLLFSTPSYQSKTKQGKSSSLSSTSKSQQGKKFVTTFLGPGVSTVISAYRSYSTYLSKDNICAFISRGCVFLIVRYKSLPGGRKKRSSEEELDKESQGKEDKEQ